MARRIGVAIERVEGGGGRRLGGSIIGHVPRFGRFSPENRRHLPPIRSTRCSSRTRNYPSLLYPRRRILCISEDGRGGGGGWMLKLINELGTKKINRTFRHEITCSISYIYVSWLTSLMHARDSQGCQLMPDMKFRPTTLRTCLPRFG